MAKRRTFILLLIVFIIFCLFAVALTACQPEAPPDVAETNWWSVEVFVDRTYDVVCYYTKNALQCFTMEELGR